MDNLEKNILTDLAQASLVEQRRARRWKIFFRLTYLVLAAVIFVTLTADDNGQEKGPHTAIIDIDGVIASGAPANAYDVIAGLERAFESKDVEGIIIRINSPGGSPVQSELINQEINRLRSLKPD
ncbi:MAG: S49 family peptidase, partial [Betaproteobacteria bacterium]|nr:S49 family peptidase [Betaproteobacteria bacterium]